MRLETNLIATIWGGHVGRIAAIEVAPGDNDAPCDYVSVELKGGVVWVPSYEVTSTHEAAQGVGKVARSFLLAKERGDGTARTR